MSFLKLIRLPNLGIVVLTQYLLYYLVIRKVIVSAGITPVLNDVQLGLLAFITVLITASGYIFNDIIDLEIDQRNKPHKVMLGKKVSLQTASWSAGFMLLVGFLLSFYLAMSLQRLPYLSIFPIAVFGLLLYNLWLKGLPLLGNSLVALYCAGVAGILWLAEKPALDLLKTKQPEGYQLAWAMVLWYMLFAFFTNFIREMVKDFEDKKGDQRAGLRTMPIAWGELTARWLIGIFSFILLFIVGYYGWKFGAVFQKNILAYLCLAILLPLLVSVGLSIRANGPGAWHTVSQLWKGIMVLGLLLLLFF